MCHSFLGKKPFSPAYFEGPQWLPQACSCSSWQRELPEHFPRHGHTVSEPTACEWLALLIWADIKDFFKEDSVVRKRPISYQYIREIQPFFFSNRNESLIETCKYSVCYPMCYLHNFFNSSHNQFRRKPSSFCQQPKGPSYHQTGERAWSPAFRRTTRRDPPSEKSAYFVILLIASWCFNIVIWLHPCVFLNIDIYGGFIKSKRLTHWEIWIDISSRSHLEVCFSVLIKAVTLAQRGCGRTMWPAICWK